MVLRAEGLNNHRGKSGGMEMEKRAVLFEGTSALSSDRESIIDVSGAGNKQWFR